MAARAQLNFGERARHWQPEHSLTLAKGRAIGSPVAVLVLIFGDADGLVDMASALLVQRSQNPDLIDRGVCTMERKQVCE